jgi:hypothetical protein
MPGASAPLPALLLRQYQSAFVIRSPKNLPSVNANGRGASDTARPASGVANMDMPEIIVVVLLVLVGAGLAYYLLQHGTQPQRAEIQRNFGGKSEIQQEFARVFYMTSAQGRGNLIKRWMERSGCDRTEAMRLATEEWRRDNR